MSKTVTLTMTEEHARTVQDACEMLMRMKLGQPYMPTDLMLGFPNKDMDINEFGLRRDFANNAMKQFLFAAKNPKGKPKDKIEMLAYEVYGTIRYALYLADGGYENSWSAAAQEPLSESGLDMPKCEVRDDEDDRC